MIVEIAVGIVLGVMLLYGIVGLIALVVAIIAAMFEGKTKVEPPDPDEWQIAKWWRG